jgi:catechol 2,3-dioxygenase-like lactoylglutathione lyase family enzyme
MSNTPILDHIALTTPDLDALVERLTGAFGMAVESRFDNFALLADPTTGLKLELSRSGDGDVHFRHFGFRTADVDAAHATLAGAGMQASEAPHRRDFARMYTSFLKQPDGFEVQLVKYD